MTTLTHKATCTCGQLCADCAGEPVRVSICHCTACQQRTGSAFGAQARFPAHSVSLSGASTGYTRVADSGARLTFRFCPSCGSTVYYTNDALPGFVGVPLGAFAGSIPWAPAFSVYERSKSPWLALSARMDRSAS